MYLEGESERGSEGIGESPYAKHRRKSFAKSCLRILLTIGTVQSQARLQIRFPSLALEGTASARRQPVAGQVNQMLWIGYFKRQSTHVH